MNISDWRCWVWETETLEFELLLPRECLTWEFKDIDLWSWLPIKVNCWKNCNCKVTWGNFSNGVTSGLLSSDDYNSSLLPTIQWYPRANNVQRMANLTELTLGAHAQRGLQYLIRVSLCVSVTQHLTFHMIVHATNDTNPWYIAHSEVQDSLMCSAGSYMFRKSFHRYSGAILSGKQTQQTANTANSRHRDTANTADTQNSFCLSTNNLVL